MVLAFRRLHDVTCARMFAWCVCVGAGCRRTDVIPPALLGDYQKLLSSVPSRRLNPAKVPVRGAASQGGGGGQAGTVPARHRPFQFTCGSETEAADQHKSPIVVPACMCMCLHVPAWRTCSALASGPQQAAGPRGPYRYLYAAVDDARRPLLPGRARAQVAECRFLNNRLVDVVAFMENISLKDSVEKVRGPAAAAGSRERAGRASSARYYITAFRAAHTLDARHVCVWWHRAPWDRRCLALHPSMRVHCIHWPRPASSALASSPPCAHGPIASATTARLRALTWHQ